MKKLVLSLSIVALFLGSCSSDNEDISTQPLPTGTISGDITTAKSFPKGNYTIQGTVKVKNGGSLTIEAGSVITATVGDGTPDALLVENGGKLFLNGTAALPIVFTETSKTPGSWGGIIMFGDAPIVGANGVTTATSEDGNNLPYGGTNAAHNGGSLKYVRVEYAGKKLTDNTSEMNGFSFYSVGSGTVLENLVAYKGADDGFEFYGGTVSAKNLISFGNFDDSFDWQDGWRGEANTNWYAYQVGTGNYGMEIEAKAVNNAFGPKVSNITLTRAPGTVTEGGSSANEFDAIQFKKDGNGEYSNVVISGYTTTNATLTATAVRIQDKATNDNQVNGGVEKIGKIKMLNVKINDGTSQYAGVGTTFTVTFPTANFTTSTTATGATLTAGAWAIVDGVSLIK
ncbi:hypothetical protein SAMN05444143_105110 [Flavobacterium succinicans]|jgi:hypothetical protein|uniref:Lipoprotein n=1 Tax=Flavobacterium succinicans TaxID=29536 RepID=A0A1I4VQH8_9FLAO|nr:hypothetical protein [Flavobacterium succinicans]SFN03337.1 hypothetical protein SAMN05444143_105110 [Flavobacterium succinicans]